MASENIKDGPKTGRPRIRFRLPPGRLFGKKTPPPASSSPSSLSVTNVSLPHDFDLNLPLLPETHQECNNIVQKGRPEGKIYSTGPVSSDNDGEEKTSNINVAYYGTNNNLEKADETTIKQSTEVQEEVDETYEERQGRFEALLDVVGWALEDFEATKEASKHSERKQHEKSRRTVKEADEEEEEEFPGQAAAVVRSNGGRTDHTRPSKLRNTVTKPPSTKRSSRRRHSQM